MITKTQALEDCSWLGRVVQIHSIGRYDLVETRKDDTMAKGNPERVSYHVYVDGARTAIGSDTIEGGLLIAIAYAANDKSASAAPFAARVLGIKWGARAS